jgi:hypothetical protein
MSGTFPVKIVGFLKRVSPNSSSTHVPLTWEILDLILREVTVGRTRHQAKVWRNGNGLGCVPISYRPIGSCYLTLV